MVVRCARVNMRRKRGEMRLVSVSAVAPRAVITEATPATTAALARGSSRVAHLPSVLYVQPALLPKQPGQTATTPGAKRTTQRNIIMILRREYVTPRTSAMDTAASPRRCPAPMWKILSHERRLGRCSDGLSAQ